jgi:hypothetical protein
MEDGAMKAWALYLALACPMTGLQTMAKTQDPTNAASSSKAPPATKTPPATEEKKPADGTKPKKIWTNDEVGSLKGDVSVVGKNVPAERQMPSGQYGSRAAAEAQRAKVQRYRAAIAELRKKIDSADQKISQLQNFKGNDSSPGGGINPTRGYGMTPVDEQVKQLEAKKQQLLANIEDLEIQAKQEGIEPGELR